MSHELHPIMEKALAPFINMTDKEDKEMVLKPTVDELGKEIYSQLLNFSRYTIVDKQDACLVINPITQASKIAAAIISYMEKS